MSAEITETTAPALPFPPVYRSHIIHCSYHHWYPKYRPLTPKARIIPLTDAFLDYLRADGIYLPKERRRITTDDDSGIYSDEDENDSDDGEDDVTTSWSDVHEKVCDVIDELGGKVTPKMNWSAPKDATWISATNDMECKNASDVYLLLKSSDFVTHDLEHAFDDTVEDPVPENNEDKGKDVEKRTDTTTDKIPYILVLRKYFNLNPSVEFRVFVRNRQIICLCQRDLNYFDFLFPLQNELRQRIQEFFDKHLKDTFPDDNFVFDVYIPAPHDRVWLIDINPFAPRTDPVLFSWTEILDIEPTQPESSDDEPDAEDSESDVEEEIWIPEFRLVKKNDPEAYNFTSQKYSAHKMPKDVVDASRSGPGGMSEFLGTWKEMLEKNIKEDQEYQSSEEDEEPAARQP
ncbi:cell cycle control protein Cdc123 [Ascosphaera apis ARSEF 7405]|uniref:Cell cycle control protein Cdc123 n=1 Tax=Ascosphaera apis ARSEF 7405 TaxID=392613 RepID=A0A162I1Q6_9EURO|nr:cell cycle control protein Cdc123 [Ascosphaera apis ARSEF 7405]